MNYSMYKYDWILSSFDWNFIGFSYFSALTYPQMSQQQQAFYGQRFPNSVTQVRLYD